jgi:hypothetical protein
VAEAPSTELVKRTANVSRLRRIETEARNTGAIMLALGAVMVGTVVVGEISNAGSEVSQHAEVTNTDYSTIEDIFMGFETERPATVITPREYFDEVMAAYTGRAEHPAMVGFYQVVHPAHAINYVRGYADYIQETASGQAISDETAIGVAALCMKQVCTTQHPSRLGGSPSSAELAQWECRNTLWDTTIKFYDLGAEAAASLER